MSKEEMICKNCKYHYIEEISFDYPQSCCDKRKAVIEEWFNCNDFEYSDRYIKQLQKENNKQKEVIDKAIEYINNLRIWYEHNDNICSTEDKFKNDLLEILKEEEND